MASTTTTAKTVVVADDTAFVRDRFRVALESAGHKAILVKSAAELLAKVKTDLPNGWKAGQEIEMTGTSFFMISEGKISEVIDAS